MNRRGLLILLSSPSGAGKSTLTKRLLKWDSSIRFSVSATTRPPRKGEVDGKDYYFTDPHTFESMKKNGSFIEHAWVFGHSYGTPFAPVEDALRRGIDIVFDVDWQGAQQISNSEYGRQLLKIFILPPSIAELRSRLVHRGQDSAQVIAKRMENSWDEISHWDGYDYVLINDDLDATEAKLKSIVTAERLRRSQQPGLTDHVRKLQSEFEDQS